MAESLPSLGRSILIGSDQIPDHYCEPCFEANAKVKPVAGYCKDCDENLCLECFTSHLGPRLFRNHKLVDKSTKPKTRLTPPAKSQNLVEDCLLHHGERIQAYCHSHSTFICKVCFAINHETCQTEEIAKLARNIQDSQALRNLNQKLNTLKKGFNDNQSKTGANEMIIQKNHSNALDDMKKLREEFDKLMNETEKQADKVKEEDFAKIETVSATCDIVIEQINKLTARLDTLQNANANESLFIAMKRAENQLQSLEENLEKLDKDNTARKYTFEPDEKVMLNDLKVLGQLSFLKPKLDNKSAQTAQRTQTDSKSAQQVKRPTHIKVIGVKSSSDQSFNMWGSVVLPNKQLLITDWQNKKLKLISTHHDKIVSEINFSGNPFGVTKVKDDEVAVTVHPNTIQFISVSQNSMSKVRQVTVDTNCRGIAYNDKENTFIVAFEVPPRVKILDMEGTEIKCIENWPKGDKLFKKPYYVALTPDMTNIYVTDCDNNSVILLSLNGDVKAVYKDKTNSLKGLYGLCVHKSSIVYVVCCLLNTVHQLDPESGDLTVVLEKKEGIGRPMSISYCETEDKMYIGMEGSTVLKVFEMK